MATTTESRLTGERPHQGVAPGSLPARHEAGSRAVLPSHVIEHVTDPEPPRRERAG